MNAHRWLALVALLLACGPAAREPNPASHSAGERVEAQEAKEPEPARPDPDRDPEPGPDSDPVEVVARLPITLHVAPEHEAPGIELVPRGYRLPPPSHARFVLIDFREGQPFVEVETSGAISCAREFFDFSSSSAKLRGFIPREHLVQVLTSDAHIVLPGRNVELEIAASTPVSCDGGRCRVLAGGWSLVVDRELLPELGWHARAPQRLEVCGEQTWLTVPRRKQDADVSPAELRRIRWSAALVRSSQNDSGFRARADSAPSSEEAQLDVESWLERLEPGLFVALEIRAEWHGHFARRLDSEAAVPTFVIGSPCAYLHSPGHDGCESADVPTALHAVEPSWLAEPWTAYRPEDAEPVLEELVRDSDRSRRVRWSAEAGATLYTREGQELGQLLRPHGWFRARHQLDERVCFELRWLGAFQRRELCIDRDELLRRYTGPLTLTTSFGGDAPQFDRVIPLAMAYDCARQALGRDEGMARRWAIILELDERGELLRRRVEALDQGSDANFSACMRYDRGPQPSARVLRADLSVRLRAPEISHDDAW